MTKHLLTILAAGSFLTMNAQREATQGRIFHAPVFSADRAIDTIQSPALNFGIPTLYNVTGGGTVFGPNFYGDLAKAQTMMVAGNVSVIGMGVWFGAKTQTNGGPTSAVTYSLYPANGAGTNSAGPVTNAPGTPLSTINVPISSIDTSFAGAYGFRWADFSSPVPVSNMFYVGVDFSTLAAGDSSHVLCTVDTTATMPDQSWEKWNDNAWHSVSEAWNGLNSDMYIFAIIDDGFVGIEEVATVNGMRMSFRTGNVINEQMDLQFALDNASRTQLVVSDANGRVVFEQNMGDRAAGIHNTMIDASAWSNGMYVVALKSNTGVIAKKVVKK